MRIIITKNASTKLIKMVCDSIQHIPHVYEVAGDRVAGTVHKIHMGLAYEVEFIDKTQAPKRKVKGF